LSEFFKPAVLFVASFKENLNGKKQIHQSDPLRMCANPAKQIKSWAAIITAGCPGSPVFPVYNLVNTTGLNDE
jgi:hypothetical protein